MRFCKWITKAYVLILHFLIVNGKPIFVPCPTLTSPGFLFALTPDCQLITAPSNKAEQFQQKTKDVSATGPCEVSPSTGLQHPIVMVSSLKLLQEDELPDIRILYQSNKERRIVRIPSSTWSFDDIQKLSLDSLAIKLQLPDEFKENYATCSMLGDDSMRCYRISSNTLTEVNLIYNEFAVNEKKQSTSIEDHRIVLPASSLATNVPVSSFTNENGDVDLLVTHVMKYLWRVSGIDPNPHTFSMIHVPTKITPASLPHFSLPLIASPLGVSSAVCENRKSSDPPDCVHYFTDMGSYSQCLVKTSFKILVGLIPGVKNEPRPQRRALKDSKSEASTVHTVEANGEAHMNQSVIIEPENPREFKTDIRVLQAQPTNPWAIAIVAVIFVVILILILLFLICLLCFIHRHFREKMVEKEKVHKEFSRVSVHNAATKTDIEQLMQAVNAAKEMNEKALHRCSQQQPVQNEWMLPQKKLELAELKKEAQSKVLTLETPGDRNEKKPEKEKPGKIKVHVTLKEDSESATRTFDKSTPPDDAQNSSKTTWTSTVSTQQKPTEPQFTSSTYQESSTKYLTETLYQKQPNVRQIDHVCVQKPFFGRVRGDVSVNDGQKKKFVLGPRK
ncbi:unnamed protein product, partial [Mesorhabditis belari]|uniref:Envelope protein n=1 Tax=Mesorhabditis belari TaxID=2138241 RepID=A0AAF3FHU3_9BILA